MKLRFKSSLGMKLYLLMTASLLITVIAVAGRNALQFKDILVSQMKDKNVSLARSSLVTISSQIRLWHGQVNQIMYSLSIMEPDKSEAYLDYVVLSNSDFISLQVIEQKSGELISQNFSFTKKTEQENFQDKDPAKVKESLHKAAMAWIGNIKEKPSHSIFLVNLSDQVGLPILSLFIPAVTGENQYHWAVLTVWQQEMIKTLSHDEFTESFLVDSTGQTLATVSTKELMDKEKYKSHEITQLAIRGNSEFGSKDYVDQHENKSRPMLGSYAWSAPYRMATIFLRDPRVAQQQITKEISKTILITLVFFLFVLLISYHAAGKVTQSLRKLVEATIEIARGNFGYKIALTSNDEVGDLGSAINTMSSKIETLLSTQVEQARQEKELETAKAVQQTLFPKEDIKSDPFYATGSYIAASECGGDWWGHFNTPDGSQFFCVADATGHGAPAAIITAIAFSSCLTMEKLYTNSQLVNSPHKVLEQLNKVLSNAGLGVTTMTFFASFMDFKNKKMYYANAGHNIPYILPADPANDKRLGGAKKHYIPLQSRGTPLGLDPESSYECHEIEIFPGDKFFYFTDGLIECRNEQDEMYGKRQLLKVLEENAQLHPVQLKETVLDSAFKFYKDRTRDDDITVVIGEISKDWKA